MGRIDWLTTTSLIFCASSRMIRFRVLPSFSACSDAE